MTTQAANLISTACLKEVEISGVVQNDSSKTSDTEILRLTTALVGTNLKDKPSPTLVATAFGVEELVQKIDAAPKHPPSLYVDLEGVNLSRKGTISIMQIYIAPSDMTYLIDIHVLKADAFTHKTKSGRTLKEILENPLLPKVFFDVRNDSDALYSHFKITLAGVQDLQLMELAMRSFSRRRVNGLAKCIEHDAPMTLGERWASNAASNPRVLCPGRSVFTEAMDEIQQETKYSMGRQSQHGSSEPDSAFSLSGL